MFEDWFGRGATPHRADIRQRQFGHRGFSHAIVVPVFEAVLRPGISRLADKREGLTRNRGPLAVLALDHVGDDAMGVE